MDAPFKVPISAQNTGNDEVSFLDGVAYGLWQGAGISDAGCAAIAD